MTLLLLGLIISPFIIPQQIYGSNPGYEDMTWKNGNPNPKMANFSISIYLKSINLGSDSYASVNIIFQQYINSTYFAETQNLNLSIRKPQYDTMDSKLLTYYGEQSYNFNGNIQTYPIDSYSFKFLISNLQTINITKNDQIYLTVFKTTNTWLFRENAYKVILKDQNENSNISITSLEINFSVFRNFSESVFAELMPLSCFGALMIIAIVIKYEDFDDQLKFKEENENKRKVKYDLSKWLFAFTLANLILNKQFPNINFNIIISYIIIGLTGSYFITTSSLEKNMVDNNFFIEWLTLILMTFIFLILLFPFFYFSLLKL